MGGGTGSRKREGEGSFKIEKNRSSSFYGFFDESDGRRGARRRGMEGKEERKEGWGLPSPPMRSLARI